MRIYLSLISDPFSYSLKGLLDTCHSEFRVGLRNPERWKLSLSFVSIDVECAAYVTVRFSRYFPLVKVLQQVIENRTTLLCRHLIFFTLKIVDYYAIHTSLDALRIASCFGSTRTPKILLISCEIPMSMKAADIHTYFLPLILSLKKWSVSIVEDH